MTTSSNGDPNLDFFRDYRQQALKARGAYIREMVEGGVSHLPPVPAAAKNGIRLFGLPFALATAAFWAVMFTLPPRRVHR